MKKAFEEAKLKVIRIGASDIFTVSGEAGGEETGGNQGNEL